MAYMYDSELSNGAENAVCVYVYVSLCVCVFDAAFLLTGGRRSVSPSAGFQTTIAEPFQSSEARRTAVKPKSIAAVKLAQDLALKAQEQEAMMKHRCGEAQAA
jgi:hypothetical protein